MKIGVEMVIMCSTEGSDRPLIRDLAIVEVSP